MEADGAPPFVVELSRLLDLRAAYHAALAETSAVVTVDDADFLAAAFLLSEASFSHMLVCGPQLLAFMRRAGLEDYVRRRSHRPFTLGDPADLARPKPLSNAPDVALWVDGRAEPVAPPLGSREALGSVGAILVGGLRAPVAAETIARYASAIEPRPTVLSLSGLGVALWRATALVLVREPLAATAAEALVRLSALVRDRSMDPLALADTCLSQRIALRARTDGDRPDVASRLRELEAENALLKNRLMKQQHALALLSAAGPETPAEGPPRGGSDER